jgi:hypothetical protein
VKTKQRSCDVGRALVEQLPAEVIAKNYGENAKKHRKRAEREIAVAENTGPPKEQNVVCSGIATISNGRTYHIVERSVRAKILLGEGAIEFNIQRKLWCHIRIDSIYTAQRHELILGERLTLELIQANQQRAKNE